MHSSTLFGFIAAMAAAVEAGAVKGFNYGSTQSDGSAIAQAEYQSLFTRAQNLPGTSPFTSARLYTMIQAGTTNSPSEAIPAAIATGTGLLLGMWCSAGQQDFTYEIQALQAAISTYGTKFTDLVQGISVGSEDLYRDSVTGIANKDGVGVGPDVITSYIGQVKSAIASTSLSSAAIGHVDTWDAWTNGSNSAVLQAVDWIGVDSYPYFETSVVNPIADGNSVFYQSIDAVKAVAGSKQVWVTETGWPVSGPNSGQAVASVANAEEYWQSVGCSLFGNTNTWWYTITDSLPTTPSPSFGIIGSDLSSAPLYNLTCSSSSSGPSPSGTGSNNNHGSSSTGTASATGSQSSATTIMSTMKTTISGKATTMTVPVSTVSSNSSAVATQSPSVPATGTWTATGVTPTGVNPTTSPSSLPTNAASAFGASSFGLFVVAAAVALL